jgi:dihydroxy-acid dehydratase
LALLRTGDTVRVDIGKRTANILISDAELEKRRAAWKPNIKESQTPWQELQRKFVGQLASGACLDFAVDFQRIAQTKGVPRHSH